METLWLKMERVLGCFALNVREMFTRRSRRTPQSSDICNSISIGLSRVPTDKGAGFEEEKQSTSYSILCNPKNTKFIIIYKNKNKNSFSSLIFELR